jgi:opacity protein-like surface antigen
MIMKKSLVLFCLFSMSIAGFNSARAQFSVGVNAGLLKFEDSEALFGLNFSGKYSINDKMRAGLNLGYYFDSEDGFSFFVQPITGLFEYSFLDSDFSPYAGLDVGFYRVGFRFDGESEAESNLGFAPTAGVNYNLSDKLALNANFKYHYVLFEGESSGIIGVNAGVVIKL